MSWELVNGSAEGHLLNPTSPTDGEWRVRAWVRTCVRACPRSVPSTIPTPHPPAHTRTRSLPVASPLRCAGTWWDAFSKAVAASGVELHPPSIYPAATDSRWIRMALPDVPCFGFSAMRRTPVLLHDHDEFVPVAGFLEGIRVYQTMLPMLAGGQPPAGAAVQ